MNNLIKHINFIGKLIVVIIIAIIVAVIIAIAVFFFGCCERGNEYGVVEDRWSHKVYKDCGWEKNIDVSKVRIINGSKKNKYIKLYQYLRIGDTVITDRYCK